MTSLTVYNQAGTKSGSFDLPATLAKGELNPVVVHQVYEAERANARHPWADTKNRGEVRGGGKKPWQQKGTGRARHGSIRSPIWKGGGVTFGPLSVRTYKQKINKKMHAVAFKMCVQDKVAQELMLVVDGLPQTGKAKDLSALKHSLAPKARNVLIITSGTDVQALRAARNVARLDVKASKDVNVLDLMHHDTVILTKDGATALTRRIQ